MSYQDYKRHFPNASFEDYLEEKRAFESQSRLLEPQFPSKIFEIPINAETQFDCETFRCVLLGLEPKPSNWITLASHHLRCRLCMAWYAVFKESWKDIWQGTNLW